ncbi:MAG: TIGR02530 family flagellar biosynthesis protein [Phycisphaerales bacterium]
MGSEAAQLMRMLDPAVRPAGTPAPRVRPRPPIEEQGFDEILRNAEAETSGGGEPVKISGHAQQRLDQMGVSLDEGQMRALGEATDRAASKGANESLMLMDRLGLIVNIRNRTVITALSEQRMRQGIVTQIDSTVWVQPPRGDGADVPSP